MRLSSSDIGWSAVRQGGPHCGHPNKMRLQSRAIGFDRKLHAVCLQAETLQRMLSRTV